MRMGADSGNVDSPRGHFNCKEHINRTKPVSVHTSTVNRSAAANPSQWAFKNSFQLVHRLRSGAGSDPLSRKVLKIVDRPIS